MAITNSTIVETSNGIFKVSYHQFKTGSCVAFSMGDLDTGEPLVRMHSSCLFSEAFDSIDCDCKLQLEYSLRKIANESSGVIVYLYQEGRGHGLDMKIKAMEVEKVHNIDTFEAFKTLNLNIDPRDYDIAISALKDLAVSRTIRLITNNPNKERQLSDRGFKITERVKLSYPINEKIASYLKVKKDKMGHSIESH